MTQADDLEQLAARLRVLEGRVGAYERDRLAQRLPDPTEARLGFMESPSGVAGAGPYEEHALIAADIITAREITAGSITATEIGAAAITAEKIATAAVFVSALARSDGNLLDNWSFEDGSNAVAGQIYGWSGSGFGVQGVSASSEFTMATGAGQIAHGLRVLRHSSTGAASTSVYSALIPVRPGATYRLTSSMQRITGANAVRTQMRTFDETGTVVVAVALTFDHSTSTMTGYTGTYTVPATGVAFLQVRCWPLNDTSGDDSRWDAISLIESSATVKNDAGEVLINPSGITVTNGKITVSNAGATVIIDGTSNMFKIAASGTTSRTQSAAGTGSTSVTLTALGSSNTVTPAYLAWLSSGSSNAFPKHSSPTFFGLSPTRFVATTSGGSPTLRVAGFYQAAVDNTSIVSGEIVYTLEVINGHAADSITIFSRFYILKEAAL